METEGVTANGSVAYQAFRSARIMPDLGPQHAAVSNKKRLIQAGRIHPCCVGLARIPTVGDAIDSGTALYQQAGFQPPRRFGNAVGQFKIKLLDPNRPGGKAPWFSRVKRDKAVRVWH